MLVRWKVKRTKKRIIGIKVIQVPPEHKLNFIKMNITSLYYVVNVVMIQLNYFFFNDFPQMIVVSDSYKLAGFLYSWSKYCPRNCYFIIVVKTSFFIYSFHFQIKQMKSPQNQDLFQMCLTCNHFNFKYNFWLVFNNFSFNLIDWFLHGFKFCEIRKFCVK